MIFLQLSAVRVNLAITNNFGTGAYTIGVTVINYL